MSFSFSFAGRFNSGLYIALVAVASLAAYGYTLRKDGIFSCPGTGYGPDSYLAYCEANQYGDYDHGAFWFGALEPGVRQFLRGAQVLFVGNSRMQFGFSSDATRSWFAAAGAPYYLMGFAYWENYQFEWPLLQRVKPKPMVYVVNLDLFFGTVESGPARLVMGDSGASSHYRRKRVWQVPHRLICSLGTRICGDHETFFRSISTGEYTRSGGTRIHDPVSFDLQADAGLAADYVKRGREFFRSLPVDRKCILLTIVPSKDTHVGTARAIADALGFTLIAPQIADLTMFDHAHLDRPSAERWSRAFFEAAGPQIRGCLNHGAGAGAGAG
jgi:hypothetical protein